MRASTLGRMAAIVLACAACGPAFAQAHPWRATPEQVAADPGAVWNKVIATGELDVLYAQYDALDLVGYTRDGIEPDKCREHLAALREATALAPVSIALRRASMLCTEAVGDEAAADREMAALGALMRHVMKDAGEGIWAKPVRSLGLVDVYGVLAVLGYDFRYEYYERLEPAGTMPMRVAAWDPEAKVERHLAFDIVEALAAVTGERRFRQWPSLRHEVTDLVVEGQAERDEIVGTDLSATREARFYSDTADRVDELRDAASHGGVRAQVTWLQHCLRTREPRCGDGFAEAVLPGAEEKHAVPLVLLAIAYEEGLGVAKDPKAAAKLLDAADARWHQRGATVFHARVLAEVRDGRLPERVLARLRDAAKAGSDDARLLLLEEAIEDKRIESLSQDDIAFLSRPVANGRGEGLLTIAWFNDARNRNAVASLYVDRAGEAGSGEALWIRAIRLREAGLRERDWLPKLERAALLGDAEAAMDLAERALWRDDDDAAWGWVEGARREGYYRALYVVGALDEQSLDPERRALARELYESLASEGEDGAEARRRLARLDVRADPAARSRAIARLQPDADAGDVRSKATLGLVLMGKGATAEEFTRGQALVSVAAVRGDDLARVEWGTALAHDTASATQRKLGLRHLRAVDPEGEFGRMARNNLAWALCVSPHQDVYKPAEGLALIREENARFPLKPGYRDTLAACLAATGDFAAAAREQQAAVDAVAKAGGDTTAYAKRLALYRARKAWREPAN
jgi:TPR repeat protein